MTTGYVGRTMITKKATKDEVAETNPEDRTTTKIITMPIADPQIPIKQLIL